MQNDFEIAGQLNLLWEKISEGITEANKVLEQVRKVELDVSSAGKVNAEIAEVIEVETSRAKSEFELEISRAISEFELEISRAISEVQPEISRAETAKAEIAKVIKVEISRVETAKAEIAKVIEAGISRAKSEFELEISRAKSEFELQISRAISEVQPEIFRAETAKAEIAKVIKAQISRVETAKAEIAAFESLIKEIGGSAGLKKLCHELQEGREVAFKLETYHQQEKQKLLLENMDKQQKDLIRQGKQEQEKQKLLLENMGQQQQQLIWEGKQEQEKQKRSLEKMGQQQQQLIRLGLLTIFIVSVSVLLISLIK